MFNQWLNKRFLFICFFLFCISLGNTVYAGPTSLNPKALVVEQINLLKNRLNQAEKELSTLQLQHEQELAQLTMEKASKHLLAKAALDVSVAKSNLESINIELADCRQSINWLEKNTQEADNQLNVLGIFGGKIIKNEAANVQQLRTELDNQQQLLVLEKQRAEYLQKLQKATNEIVQYKNENYARIDALLKSRTMLQVNEQQMKNELIYQRQQNDWLQQLNVFYAQLAKVDPNDRQAYSAIERDIFYTNEKANLAYTMALLARYQDQIEQMKLATMHSNSISLLNQIKEQMLVLNKQALRLKKVLRARISMLGRHVDYLAERKKNVTELKGYIQNLRDINAQYMSVERELNGIQKELLDFRVSVERSLQVELSARQGLPSFGVKSILDLGKEMLLVPTLTYKIILNLSNHVVAAFETAGFGTWCIFLLLQTVVLFFYTLIRSMLAGLLARPSEWREKMNSKWLSTQWLYRNLVDITLIGNIFITLFFFSLPLQYFMPVISLVMVWLVFKSIHTTARLCLVETTHDTTGHDMRLYQRLKWLIWIGGVIVAFTVYVHQLPLIYELKALCDRVFLFLLMLFSIFLLRSWHVVPDLILSQSKSPHPYLEKTIRLVGVLVPLLMFSNSVIGLLGYVNLIMTVTWYEGLFLVVLISYLVLRGLLSEGMEQLSSLTIQHVNNGWLWTEAFLKPLDKVLRIALFLMAWAGLFLLYGWDKQSPIVERLTRLLHYNLIHISHTAITPYNTIQLFVVISVFYWTARWTREFVYRMLSKRTNDMGIRNSLAILSQYTVVLVGVFLGMRVLGIDVFAMTAVASAFAFGVGLGLRDLANNFACGLLLLLERPLRVGDIVNVNGIEGDVIHIGGRSVTIRTWDHMELVVPNCEIFNKSFTNWTAKDTTVRSIIPIVISRYDNPHEVKTIILDVLASHKDVLKDPVPEVYLKAMSDILMDFELRIFVNIRAVRSRTSVVSDVLLKLWDAFALHGIKPAHPQQEIVLRGEMPQVLKSSA